MDYHVKKVELKENGMDRVGFFVYHGDYNTDFSGLGKNLVGGFVVKRSNNAIYTTNGPYNLGMKVESQSSEVSARESAEYRAYQLVERLSKPQIQMPTPKPKKKKLEVAVA